MATGFLVLLGTLSLGAPPSDVWTMRVRHLEIPILVNEVKRAELKELELHLSTDQGRTWQLISRAEPNKQSFNFHAASDGLYWFTVCAIDKAGYRDPADIAQAPANRILKVLIDTHTPALRIVAADRVGDDCVFTWETLDIQSDPASLRVEYRSADAGPNADWQRVPINPALNGQTRFRPQTNGPITIRLQINDSTGTPATVVKDLPATTAAPAHAIPVNPVPVMVPPAAPLTQPVNIQQSNSIAPPPSVSTAPLGQVPNVVVGPPPAIPTADSPGPIPAAASPVPPSLAAAPVVPTPSESPQGLAPLPARTGAETATRPPLANGAPDFGSTTSPHLRGALPDVQHVRDKQVSIDFEVERKGPSGVKRIEVYMTPDDGRTWSLYSETSLATSPLLLTLPEFEGIYGFRLVLFSGADQSIGPPRSGDSPDPGLRLLVDRTSPKVSLYPPTVAPGQPNALTLHYDASDSYLDPKSVSLYWSQQPIGNWQPIHASAPRTSSLNSRFKECTWSLPADLPDRVYLRVTACDLAGNQGEAITRDPVTVDLHRPTARVTGITIGQQRK